MIANYKFIELFRYIGSKLNYNCFISINVAMYDMQITSYDANLCFLFFIFFYGWIHNLHDYSTYKVIINMFFALNPKYVRSYDPRSDLTIHDPTYLPWSYVGSWFWQPCLVSKISTPKQLLCSRWLWPKISAIIHFYL